MEKFEISAMTALSFANHFHEQIEDIYYDIMNNISEVARAGQFGITYRMSRKIVPTFVEVRKITTKLEKLGYIVEQELQMESKEHFYISIHWNEIKAKPFGEDET